MKSNEIIRTHSSLIEYSCEVRGRGLFCNQQTSDISNTLIKGGFKHVLVLNLQLADFTIRRGVLHDAMLLDTKSENRPFGNLNWEIRYCPYLYLLLKCQTFYCVSRISLIFSRKITIPKY